MALLFSTSRPSIFFVPAINPTKSTFSSLTLYPKSRAFSLVRQPRPLRFSRVRSSRPPESNFEPENALIADEWGESSESESESDSDTEAKPESGNVPVITDEWGERSDPGPEEASTRLADSDPPVNEDEWEEEYRGDSEANIGNGSPGYDRAWELKRCLADTVYGTELGFRADSEVRAEVLELVNQLEALNPTPAPVESPELLDYNWVLLYTSYSELLPLLAVGATTPLLKVKKITQSIDSKNLLVENSVTLSSPLADFSFSASASFEVQSPSRIQVTFKEGIFEPPEIKSKVDLPESVNVFGQNLSLIMLKQTLNPLQELAGSLSRSISGQQSLRVPFLARQGNANSSWLLTTYLDKDLRISRGDGGGLFLLARQGSSLLQL